MGHCHRLDVEISIQETLAYAISRSARTLLTRHATVRILLAALIGIAVYVGGAGIQSSPDSAEAASCEGANACTGATATIGVESCKGIEACLNATGSIGDNACIGDYACSEAGASGGSSTIGSDSCHGFEACIHAGYDDGGFASVADGSCDGANACSYIGEIGHTEIGTGSCLDGFSCYQAGSDGGRAVIGDGSCVGLRACFIVGDIGGSFEAGDGSCNSESACEDSEGPTTIGNWSCNALHSCDGYRGIIGDLSCNEERACFYLNALGPGDIGNLACNGFENCEDYTDPVADCTRNTVTPPACNLTVTKEAEPDEIPETGNTPVTFTVRVDFLEDEEVNFIEDDQFEDLGLNPSDYCDLFEQDGTNLGAISLPDSFIIDQHIICEYTYEPPPGNAGDTHDNVVTVNAGHPDCPEEEGPTGVTPADHECETQGIAPAAISPGKVPGTNDVRAEASVLYLEVAEPEPTATPQVRQEPQRPPNIGAGLSGLFNGMPTPLPTAPSAVAPAVTTIRPPSTGNGGIAGGSIVDRGSVIGAVAVVVFAGIAITRHRRT
jgi:hypothetical protein